MTLMSSLKLQIKQLQLFISALSSLELKRSYQQTIIGHALDVGIVYKLQSN